MEEREKILSFAQTSFLNDGFYKTTMDEISGKLKISKKTIYKHFDSKNELVTEIVMRFIDFNSKNITDIILADQNAIYKFNGLIIYLGNMLIKMSAKFFYDLENYMPLLWRHMDEFRTKLMIANLTKLVEQGKKEGLIIDSPAEIIVNTFVSSIRGIIRADFLMNNPFTAKDAVEKTIELLMRGILTSKGDKMFGKIKRGN